MIENKKTQELLSTFSSSFCAAKWYNATIWLSNGRTASCHHPIAHNIPLQSIENNPSKLHNTDHKKKMRQLMLEGKRPSECSYCWTVEDKNNKDIFSDRIYKSRIYLEKEINDIKNIGDNDVDPKTLEISFDNLCNLSCSYCNHEFSSTWMNDIKKNGPYENIKTPGGKTYTHTNIDIENNGEENIYIKKFYEWFESSLKNNLQELRVTGGEPTRSPHFWKLLEMCDGTNFKFAVNSNLIMTEDRLQKLIECSFKFKSFDLYTSCESYGNHAEFVRHGLNYDTWKNNLKEFAKNGSYNMINIMMTISVLSIWTIVEFMEDLLSIRNELKDKNLFFMSFNILRFPSFQSINTLPKNLKLQLSNKIENFHNNNLQNLNFEEANQILRLVLYLREVDLSYEDTDKIENKHNDLYNFLIQYAKRRNLNIDDHFPIEFLTWFDTLNDK